MGLDMYFYRFERGVFTDQRQWEQFLEQEGPIEMEEIAYFRKHSDLHWYLEQLWRERTSCRKGEMFNLRSLVVQQDDVEEILAKAERHVETEYEFERGYGPFWGQSMDYDWQETIKLMRQFLATFPFDKETLIYDSWW